MLEKTKKIMKNPRKYGYQLKLADLWSSSGSFLNHFFFLWSFWWWWWWWWLVLPLLLLILQHILSPVHLLLFFCVLQRIPAIVIASIHHPYIIIFDILSYALKSTCSSYGSNFCSQRGAKQFFWSKCHQFR